MLRHVLRRIPRIHSAAFSRTSLITKPLGPVTSCRSFGLTVPHVTENPKSSIMTISALRSCSSLASTKASNQAPPSISSSARPPSQEDEGNWLSIGDLEEDQKQPDAFEGISLERGRTGVFDVEDLVSILRREKVDNIAVISVPSELQYVDFMVIGTGRSPRQMTAVATFIRRVFKLRSVKDDWIPNVEGVGNKDWIALDLGNIVLHIFSGPARKVYDLETLWTCGAKYDDLCNDAEDDRSHEAYARIFHKARDTYNNNNNNANP